MNGYSVHGYDGYRCDFNHNCVTIAEVREDAGDTTSMCGKWLVTTEINPRGPKRNWPRQREFGRF